MTWRTHLMGGLAILWILAPASADTLAQATIAASLGALLPDLDAGGSNLSSASLYGRASLRPLSLLLFRRLGHRGVLHSFLAWVVVTLMGGILSGLIAHTLALGVGLSMGYLSHLLLDACTRSGVPLFWPNPVRVHLLLYRLRITTGSLAEDVVFALLALASFALYFSKLPQALSPA
jgi:inner membrane protein